MDRSPEEPWGNRETPRKFQQPHKRVGFQPPTPIGLMQPGTEKEVIRTGTEG